MSHKIKINNNKKKGLGSPPCTRLVASRWATHEGPYFAQKESGLLSQKRGIPLWGLYVDDPNRVHHRTDHHKMINILLY